MNVISLHQPYASLVMTGTKLWETRDCPPNGDMRPEGVRGLPGKQINAGNRIGVAATMRRPKTVTAWDQGSIPALVAPAALGYGVLPGWDQTSECEFGGGTFEWSGPLGALLGTVEVVGALPIVGPTGPLVTPEIVTLGDGRLTVWYPPSGAPGDEPDERDISDQLPFGHWVPGGWAWQLANPEPFAAPIPVKGKQGVWEWTP